MDSITIRQKFLDFFRSKQHVVVPSAPIVSKDDPTLMFTNAGMNQFKDYFLGNKKIENPRVVDTQKCLRVSGKHNDLEEVGMDTYHHTMFEMLGNWSFGDYFKKETVEWSWEVLTELYGLPAEDLYVTVFGGDKNDNLEADDEAFRLWEPIAGKDKILYGDKTDNFWEMGDQGPCGPSSEIHIDLRPEEEKKETPAKELVNKDHPLVVEIWNLVFIQFNRKADGSLESLPAKHIDTGMGFERLVMAIQGKKSNYDTDIFQPLIQYLEKVTGKKYGDAESTDIAMRVVADHIRAIAFTIADGQLPGNAKAGYVIRRILRRAVRYGYTFLNFREPFLYRLVTLLCEQFGHVFPGIKEQKEFVENVIKEEENSFLRTLEVGLKRLEHIASEMGEKSDQIDGKTVFELYDTYGFPVDLTALIAREYGLRIDEPGFEKEMQQQKNRSRKAATVETSDWQQVKDADRVEFIGYDDLESRSNIIKYRTVKQKNKNQYQVVLDKTPFYAESGGQVGDKGVLLVGNEEVNVLDTKKENELIIHLTDKLPSDPEAEVKAVVDKELRERIQFNHSATHLIHAALRQVLGDHVVQKGSLVNEKVLRFDFSHFSKVEDEELEEVERIVNARIRKDIPLEELREVPMEEAKKMGAMALFGEKYGNVVRVVTFDKDFSVELCGGTHVPSTGKIGFFKIVSEGSVASGIRRIEAVTAEAAENYVNDELKILKSVKESLKNPKDLLKAVENLQQDKASLQKEVEQMMAQKAQDIKSNLLFNIEKKDTVSYIIDCIKVDSADIIKDIAFDIKGQVENLFMVLGANVKGKAIVTVMISENLVKEKGLHAGNIVKELAREIKGGGGGQAFYATAGGKDVEGLERVMEKAGEYLKEASA